MTPKPSIKIELTAEQQAQIQERIGKPIAAVELKPELLEQRIAPLRTPN